MNVTGYSPMPAVMFGRKYGARQAVAALGITAISAASLTGCSTFEKSSDESEGAPRLSDTGEGAGSTGGQEATGPDVSKIPQILLEGDSLSVATVDENYSYADQLTQTLGNQATVVSVAAPNETLANLSAQLPETASYLNTDSASNTVVLWSGTNDIANGLSGDDAFANYVALAEGYKAAGFQVVAVTAIQSGGVNDNAERDAARSRFNELLRTQQDLFHGFADVGAIPALSSEDNAVTTNTAIYDPNGFHLTPEGYALVASKVQEALQPLLAGETPAPEVTPTAEPTPTPTPTPTPAPAPEPTPAPVPTPAPTPEPPSNNAPDQKYVNMMSQNIWHTKWPGARKNWQGRMAKIARIIKSNDAEIITLQEASRQQVKELKKDLGPNYKTFPGAYSTQMGNVSERTIIYKAVDDGKPAWKLQESGMYAIPDYPDHNLDNPTRGMPWGQFVHAQTGQEVVATSVHATAWDKVMDPGGALKRERAGHILADWAQRMKQRFQDAVVVVSGDINQRDKIRSRPPGDWGSNDNAVNGDRNRMIPCLVGEELRAIDDIEAGRKGKCPVNDAGIDQAFTNADDVKGVHTVRQGQSDHAGLLYRVKLFASKLKP